MTDEDVILKKRTSRHSRGGKLCIFCSSYTGNGKVCILDYNKNDFCLVKMLLLQAICNAIEVVVIMNGLPGHNLDEVQDNQAMGARTSWRESGLA